MAIFQPRPFQAPNLRTDYSAENSAWQNLGKTLGDLPGDLRKEQLAAKKEQLLGQLAGPNPDFTKVGVGLAAIGDAQGGAALIGLGQKAQEVEAYKNSPLTLGGSVASSASASPAAAPSTPQNLVPLFAQAEAKYGLPGGYLPRVAQIESSNNPNAQNPNSSAGGLFQFIDSTAKRYNLADKTDPVASTDAAARLAADNKASLTQVLGREPTAGELYLAHQQGAGGAAKLLSNPNARAIDVVGPDAVRLNGGNPSMTAGEFASRWINKVDGGRPVQMAQAAPQPGAAVPDAANIPAPSAVPVSGPGTVQAAQAQGFAIPGTSLPPNDPAPRVSTNDLVRILGNPRLASQHALAKQILDARQKYSDENAPDKRALARTQAEKAQLDLEEARKKAGGFRSLITQEERDAAGVDPSYKGTAQVGPDGRIVYPGKASTEVNLSQKGETKFEEALGTAQAKRWNGYIEEGDAAQGRLADIQTLRDTSRRLGSQGSSANLKATIGPYAESLGIKVDGLSDIQLYESITNRLAPTLRAPGSGSTSDIEFKGFQRAIGPLSNTPAAREMILDTFEAASRNDIARSQIASRLASGEINRGQAEKELRALPDPMTSFKEFRKQNPDLVGQALKESARVDFEQRNAPVKVDSPDAYSKLKPGDKYTDPEGNVRTKR